MIAVAFNIILYFLAGLRREAGTFFIFFLFSESSICLSLLRVAD